MGLDPANLQSVVQDSGVTQTGPSLNYLCNLSKLHNFSKSQLPSLFKGDKIRTYFIRLLGLKKIKMSSARVYSDY